MARTLYRIGLLALLLWALYWLMNHGGALLPRLRRIGRTIAGTTLGELASLIWPVLLAVALIALCAYIVWRLPVPSLRLRLGRRRGRRRR